MEPLREVRAKITGDLTTENEQKETAVDRECNEFIDQLTSCLSLTSEEVLCATHSSRIPNMKDQESRFKQPLSTKIQLCASLYH